MCGKTRKKFRKKFNTIVPLVIILSLLVTTMPAGAEFSRAESAYTNKHWAEYDINRWMSNGLLDEKNIAEFRPDVQITRAEFVKLLNKLLGLVEKIDKQFLDVPEDAWYFDDVARAAAAGLVVGDGTGRFHPDAYISRQEAAVVLVRTFDLEPVDKDYLSVFVDAEKIAAWSKNAVNVLTGKGYIKGYPGNFFAPQENTTRAEALKMIDNIMGELKNAPGEYIGTIESNLVVNAAGVVLKNMIIKGDLLLAQGIGDGEVTLDNVTVKGKTIVKGGGENSIIINNSSLEGTLVVLKQDGKIRIVTLGDSSIPDIQLSSGGRLEGSGYGNIEVVGVIGAGQEITLDGDFAAVAIESPEVKLEILGGSVGKLEVKEGAIESAIKVSSGTVGEIKLQEKSTVNLAGGTIGNVKVAAGAKDTNIEVGQDTVINTFTTDAPVVVTGQGTIENANINSNGVSFQQTPQNITIKEDISVNVEGVDIFKMEPAPEPTTGGSTQEPSEPATDTYTLRYTAGPNGSITGNTPQTADHGANGSPVTAVPDEGYHFVKWSDGATSNPRNDTYVTNNIAVTAVFAINEYTATFKNHDGTIMKEETVTHGSGATSPADPIREGYTFIGWDKEFASVTSDMEVTAQYTINQYTVTFDSNGGTEADAIAANYGATITAPVAPIKEGHTFAGWYREPALDSAWDFATDTVPAEDISLYARWDSASEISLFASPHIVTAGSSFEQTFILNIQNDTVTGAVYTSDLSMGGVFSGLSLVEVRIESASTVTASVYGNLSDTGIGTITLSAEKLAISTHDLSANVTVQALTQYTVSFNKNGGNTEANPTTMTAVSGGNAGALPVPPTRENHAFTGWNTQADGSGTEFTATTAIFADITVYAQWTVPDDLVINIPSIQGVPAPATGGIPVTTITETVQYTGTVTWTPVHDPFQASTVYTATIMLTTKAGYTLAGAAENFFIIDGSPGSTVTNTADSGVITAVFPETAEVAINTHNVTFKDHDGTILKEDTVAHGASAIAPTEELIREGYTFVGWDVAFANVTADLTVTAQYAINQYTVTFDSTGGSEVADQTLDYDSLVTEPQAPTREGYTFAGWYKEETLTNAWDFETDTVPAEDITLYAKWTINTYTLTYIAGENGSLTGETVQSVVYGANGSPVTAVPAIGYHFVIWSDGFTVNPRTDASVTENVYAIAEFAINEYDSSIRQVKVRVTDSTDNTQVFSGVSVTLEYWDDDAGEIVAVTDTEGVAVFDVHGMGEYLCRIENVSGYHNYETYIELYDEDLTHEAALQPIVGYVWIYVKGQDGSNVAGAEVLLNNTSLPTDTYYGRAGYFPLRYGTYELQVTKTDYSTFKGFVTVSDTGVTGNYPVLVKYPAITFEVLTDTGFSLNGATITIGDKTVITNSGGNATLYLPPNDTYEYSVAYGDPGMYETVTGNINVAGEDINETVSIPKKKYPAVVVVTDPNGQKLADAQVILKQGSTVIDSVTTNVYGEADFVDLIMGNYSFEVSKNNYFSKNSYSYTPFLYVEINSQTVVTNVTLNPIYGYFQFNVSDGVNVLPSTQYQITVNGTALANSPYGSLPLGSYEYTVTAQGFEQASGTLVLENLQGATQYVDVVLHEKDKIITFNVGNDSDFSSKIQDAEIQINGETYSTNFEGVAAVPLKKGTYDYTVKANGYQSASGTKYVADTGYSTDVRMQSQTYSVILTVTDAVNPIAGANVELGSGNDATTDEQGKVSFQRHMGTLKYYVSAVGYDSEEGYVTVTGAEGEVVSREVTLKQKEYPVYFGLNYVKDGIIRSVQSAEIHINNNIYQVSRGAATIKLPNGTYSYEVLSEYFQQKSGSITVANPYYGYLIETITLELVPKDITITVTGSSGPIADAGVTIQGVTKTTDVEGKADFALGIGDYNYSVTAAGYRDSSGIISIPQETAKNIAMEMIPYTATIKVLGAIYHLNGQYIPWNLPGASVTIGSTTVVTGQGGNAAFELTNGAYDYVIEADSYDTVTGYLTVAGQDAAIIEETLTKQLSTVQFNVTDGVSPVYPTKITIGEPIFVEGDNVIWTDLQGQAAAQLSDGTYDYIVESDGYQTVSDSVYVSGAPAAVDIELSLVTYTVTFTVSDGTAPLAGANVYFYPQGESTQTAVTDAQGQVQFNVPKGSHYYTVEKDPFNGFNSVSGNIEVTDSDIVMDEIVMEQIKGDYGFIVAYYDGTVPIFEPIEGAQITIGSETKSTDADGKAIFQLNVGDHTYTVVKEVYHTATGSITNSPGYEEETIYMQKINYPPAANEDLVETEYNQPAIIDVLANDTDNENDPISVLSSDTVSEHGGQITINQDGTITYTPPQDFSGVDMFSYTVSDTNDGTDTALVRITVLPRDIIPPVYMEEYPAVTGVHNDRIDLAVKADEAGIAYYVVQPAGKKAPLASQVKAGKKGDGTDAEFKGAVTLAVETEAVWQVNGLAANTVYNIYLVLEDALGNVSGVTTIQAATAKPVSTLAVTDIGDTSIGLTWIEVLGATSAVLMVKPEYGDFYTKAQYAPSDEELGTANAVTVTGLAVGGKYYFKLVVADGNNSGDSNEVSAIPGFAGGTGTDKDPFVITTPSHLNNIRYLNNKHFILGADLDLNIAPYNEEGAGWEPIDGVGDNLTLYFDGNYHTINNLYINRSNQDNTGLFGSLKNSRIVNVGLSGINVTGGNNTGGLVGYAENTHIYYSYVDGNVSGSDYVGTLVGNSTASFIYNACATGSMQAAGQHTGLLTGVNNSGNITSSYAAVSINSNDNIYLTNSVSGGSVYWSYYDRELVREENLGTGDGIEKTTAEMILKSTYQGWDFSNTWAIQEGSGYPYLRWQTPGQDLEPPVFSSGYPAITNITYDQETAMASLELLTKTDEDTTIYYAVLPEGNPDAPSVAQVVYGQDGAGNALTVSGSYPVTENTENTHTLVNLSSGQRPIIYVVGKDQNGNISALKWLVVELTDISAPVFAAGYPTFSISQNSIAFSVKADEPATGYYVVLPGDASVLPDATQIIAGKDSTGAEAQLHNIFPVDGYPWAVSGLTSNTAYKLAMVMVDSEGNVSPVYAFELTTASPVSDLAVSWIGDGEVLLQWSAPLNPQKVEVMVKDELGTYRRAEYTLTDAEMQTASSVIVTGLTQLGKYNLKLVVTGGINSGDSNEVAVTLGFTGGEGTAADPFIISDIAHLNNVRYRPDSYYVLANDLDLNVAPYNSGEGWQPVGEAGAVFTGSFNGAGHAISNLYVNRPAGDNIGLFGLASTADIYDLTINQPQITGNNNTGGLVGKAVAGNVTNSTVINGNISGNNNTGGLAGLLENGTINKSAVISSGINGAQNTGGMVGSATGRLAYSYVKAAVINGSEYVGGIVGYFNNNSITASYTGGGSVSGIRGVGGIAGYLTYNASIQNSYSSISVRGNESASTYGVAGFGGVDNSRIVNTYYVSNVAGSTIFYHTNHARTDGQMRSRTTFSGWDLTNTWAIKEGQGYPYLRWQQTGEDNDPPVFTAGYPVLEISSGNETILKVKTDKNTVVYYAVIPVGAPGPDAVQVIAGSDGSGNSMEIKGNINTVAGVEATRQIAGLTGGLAYRVYLVAVDTSDNVSTLQTLQLNIPDITPPEFTAGYPVINDITAAGVNVLIKANEGGSVYYAVVPAALRTPTVREIISGTAYTDGTGGSFATAPDTETIQSISGLAADTRYMIYLVLEDISGNRSPRYTLTMDTLPEKVEISGINLENGLLSVDFAGDVRDLSLGDFTVAARLGEQDMALQGLSYDPAANIFTFTPVFQDGTAETLTVTIAASTVTQLVYGSAAASLNSGFNSSSIASSLYYERDYSFSETAKALLDAGVSVDETASGLHNTLYLDDATALIGILQDIGCDNYLTIISALKAGGYSAADAAAYLKALFPDSELAPLLKHAGYGAADVVKVIKELPASDLTQALKYLSSSSPALIYNTRYDYFHPSEVANAVKQYYGLDNQILADALWDLGGYSRDDIAYTMAIGLGAEALEVLQWLDGVDYEMKAAYVMKNYYGSDVVEAAAAMREAGYYFSGIISFLEEEYTLGQDTIASVLRNAGFSATAAGDMLDSHYYWNDDGIARKMENGGYSLAEVVSWLMARYSSSGVSSRNYSIAYLLHQTGHSLNEITFVLKGLFELDEASAEQLLTSLRPASGGSNFYTEEEILTALQDIYGTTLDVLHAEAQGLKESGSSARDTANILFGTYSVQSAVVLAGVLADAGYTQQEVTGAVWSVFSDAGSVISVLKDVYGQDATASLLKASGMSFADVAEAMITYYVNTSYAMSEITLAAQLKETGYSPDEIASMLKADFNYTDYQFIGLFRQMGYDDIEIITCFKDVYQYTFAQTIQAFYGYYASFSAAEAIGTVYGTKDTEVIAQLKAISVPDVEIAEIIRRAFGYDQYSTAKALRGAGFTGAAVVSAINAVFGAASGKDTAILLKNSGFSIGEVWTALQAEFSTDYVGNLVKYMKEAGFTASDLFGVLKSSGDYTDSELIDLLHLAAFDAEQLGSVIKTVLNASNTQAVSLLNSAGIDAGEIASILKDTYQNDMVTIAQSLKSAGMDALKVAQALKYAFGYTGIDILKEIGLSAVDIAVLLRDEFGLNAVEITKRLQAAGFTALETAQGLQATNSMPIDYQAMLLKVAGFNQDSIAAALKSVYQSDYLTLARALLGQGYSAIEVSNNLKTLYPELDADKVIKALIANSLTAADIASAISAAYGYGPEQIVSLLRTAGFESWEIGRLLLDSYTYDAHTTAQSLLNAGYGVSGAAAAIKEVFAITAADMAFILAQNNMSPEEIAGVLKTIFNQNLEATLQLLADLQIDTADLVDAVAAVYTDAGYPEIVRVLKNKGIAANEITAMLTAAQQSSVSAAQILKDAGYPLTETGAALKAGYNLNFADMVDNLRAAGYKASEIVPILSGVYNMGNTESILVLHEKLFAADEVIQAFMTVSSHNEIARLLKSAGYSLEDIAVGFKDADSISNEDNFSILQDAGFDFNEVMLLFKLKFTVTDLEMAKILINQGYTVEAVVDVLRRYYNLSAQQAGAALKSAGASDPQAAAGSMKQAGYKNEDIAGYLLAFMHANQAAGVLKNINFSSLETLSALGDAKPAVGMPFMTIALKEGGYNVNEIVYALKGYYQLTPDQAFNSTLIDLGFSYSNIASAVQAAYDLSSLKIAQILKTQGLGIDWIGMVLQDLGLTAVENASILYKEAYLPEDIVERILRRIYNNLSMVEKAGVLIDAGVPIYDAIEAAMKFSSFVEKIEVLYGNGFNATEIGYYLKDASQNASQAIVYLDDLGVTLNDLVLALRMVYQLNAQAALDQLNSSQRFTVDAINSAVGEVYNLNPIDAYIQMMASENYTLQQIIGRLHGVYGFTDITELTQALVSSGYAEKEIIVALAQTFDINAVARVLIDVFSELNPAILLKQVPYNTVMVTEVLKTITSSSEAEAVSLLVEAGFDLPSVADGLRSVYQLSDALVVHAMKTAGLGISDVGRAYEGWQYERSYVIGLLKGEGYSLNDIVEFHGSDDSYKTKALADAGYSAVQIGQAYIDVLQKPDYLVAASLKYAAGTASDVLEVFNNNPGYTSTDHNKLFAMLYGSGYAVAEIVYGFNDQLGATAGETGRILRFSLPFTINEVAAALNAGYAITDDLTLFTALNEAAYKAEDILGVFRSDFDRSAQECRQVLVDAQEYNTAKAAIILSGAGFNAVEIKNSWPDAFGSDRVAAAQYLQAEGNSAEMTLQALNTVYGNDLQGSIQALQGAGFEAINAASAVKVIHNPSYADITPILLNAHYSLIDTGRALGMVYHLPVDQIVDVFEYLRPGGKYPEVTLENIVRFIAAQNPGVSVQSIVDMLGGWNIDLFSILVKLRYPPGDLTGFTTYSLELAQAYAAPIYKANGYTAAEGLDFYDHTLGYTGDYIKTLIKVLHGNAGYYGSGYSASEIVPVVHTFQFYRPRPSEILGYLKELGYLADVSELKDAMLDYELAQAMYDNGYYPSEIAEVLKSSYGRSMLEMARMFDRVGLSAWDAYLEMERTYGETSESVRFETLLVTGYTKEEILNFYKPETSSRLQVLHQAGYSIVDIAASLRNPGGLHMSNAEAFRHLIITGGFSLSESLYAINSLEDLGVSYLVFIAEDFYSDGGSSYYTRLDITTAIESLFAVDAIDLWIDNNIHHFNDPDLVRILVRQFHLTPQQVEDRLKPVMNYADRISTYKNVPDNVMNSPLNVFDDPDLILGVLLENTTDWVEIMRWMSGYFDYHSTQIWGAIKMNLPDMTIGEALLKMESGNFVQTGNDQRTDELFDFAYYNSDADESLYGVLKQAGFTIGLASTILGSYLDEAGVIGWLADSGYPLSDIYKLHYYDTPLFIQTLVNRGYNVVDIARVVYDGLREDDFEGVAHVRLALYLKQTPFNNYNDTVDGMAGIFTAIGISPGKTFEGLMYDDSHNLYNPTIGSDPYQIVAGMRTSGISLNDIAAGILSVADTDGGDRWRTWHVWLTDKQQFEIIKSMINIDEFNASEGLDDTTRTEISLILNLLGEMTDNPDEWLRYGLTFATMRNAGYSMSKIENLLHDNYGWETAFVILSIMGLSIGDIFEEIYDIYGKMIAMKMMLSYVPYIGQVKKFYTLINLLNNL